MDPTTNRINLSSGGGSEQFILQLDTTDTTNPSQTYDAIGVDYNSNGDIFLAGYTAVPNTSDLRSTICKINKTGTAVEWSKEFNQTGHEDYGQDIRVARNESGEPVYFCGRTGNYVTHGSGSFSDCTLKKFADNGTTLWEVQWGHSSYYDVWNFMDIDNSNNIYLTGNIYPWQSGIGASKFNSSGVNQWGIKKEMAQTESCDNLAVNASNGDCWLAGRDNQPSTTRGWVGHYNTSGARVNSWFFSNGQAMMYGIDTDASGNVYIMMDNNSSWSGTSGTISGHSGSILQYKGSNSTWTWAMQSGGSSGYSYGYGLCCDKSVSQGDVYGLHHADTLLTGTSHRGIYVIRRSYAGSTIWSRMFSKSNSYVTTWAGAGNIRCDGEYIYICGNDGRTGTGARPYVIKYPVDGSVTGTFGDWTITAMTDGQSSYHAHDNNFIGSWSISNASEYSVTYGQSSQTKLDVESAGTAIIDNKENI